ncbi:M23 family metallopeptidase [Streptomyces sp. NPDC001941]|uniref:M23 family metallopeptidase n=1 Tax=Streptomyces sp. NPDC001941 TaxID=3154659 RepID=UPI003325C248
MGDHIRGPGTGLTRRAALGMAAPLLAGPLLTGTFLTGPLADDAAARGAPGPGGPGPDDCGADYDERFEADLERADAEVPEPEERFVLPARCVLPLRRRFRVTTRYGEPGDWLAGYHTGIDLAVPQGTPVFAVSAGVVVLARWSGAYGQAVTVRHRDGHFAVYGHLSRIGTRQGATVRAGARLGHSGNTGRSTGPHLHLEIRAQRDYGSDVDPLGYLRRKGVRLPAYAR